MLVALGPTCFCLTLMAFVPTLWLTTFVVLAFFGAHYVYETRIGGSIRICRPGCLRPLHRCSTCFAAPRSGWR